MNTFTNLQTNGFNKPFNLFNSTSSSSCLSPSQSRASSCNDDCPAERTAHCSSGTKTSSGFAREPPPKRFKPNINGSRSRIAHDGFGENFRTEDQQLRWQNIHQHPPNNIDCTCNQHDQRTASLPNEYTEGIATTLSQSNEAAGQGADQPAEGDADEERNLQPCGVAKEIPSTKFNTEPACTFIVGDECLSKKERTLSGSTMTSPTLSSTSSTGTGLTRDLSLGREDSVESRECSLGKEFKTPPLDLDSSSIPETCILNSKIRNKLAAKEAKNFREKSRETEETTGTEVLQKLKRAAAEQGFECLSTKCPSLDTPLTYRCPENHIFSSKEFARSQQLSCPKCEKRLNRCKAHAKAHNGMTYPSHILGKVINTSFAEYIEYECAKGHLWKVKYSE